jgi:UDP-glucuronate decarboxylase
MVPRLYDSRKHIWLQAVGFLGLHLVDRLLEKEHEVKCVDNLVTGSKRNITHLHSRARPEFVRHG